MIICCMYLILNHMTNRFYVLTNKMCCTETAFVKKNVVYVQHFYYFCTVKLNTIWTHYSERVTGC